VSGILVDDDVVLASERVELRDETASLRSEETVAATVAAHEGTRAGDLLGAPYVPVKDPGDVDALAGPEQEGIAAAHAEARGADAADVGPGGDRVEDRLEDGDRWPAPGAEIAGGAHDTAEIPAAGEEVRCCGQVPG